MKTRGPNRFKRLSVTVAKRFGLVRQNDQRFFLLVPAVGVATGILSIAITQLMFLIRGLLWADQEVGILDAAVKMSPGRRVIPLVIGGVAIGLVAFLMRGKPRGTGVGTLIESVALRGGYLATARSLLAQLVAIFTVGCGGSAGREGPLTVCGATFASKAGRAAGLSGNRLKILVGCGAAAGMAAAYNAPVGGAIFAMEVVLGNFALDTFGPIVIASVIATVISRQWLYPGGSSVYGLGDMPAIPPTELLLFAALGIIAGGLAVLFISAMEWGETLFERLPIPGYTKPVLGFAMVGGLGVLFPHVFGNGFETIDLALHQKLVPNLDQIYGSHAVLLLLVLALAKLAATSVTLGSGGAGGLFTPSMFVGAMVGQGFAMLVLGNIPFAHSNPNVYALVGMGAIAAATTHAPISAILIIYEITGSYSVILPLMAACIVSNLISRRVRSHSIFTSRLARRGIELPHRLEELVLETMTARAIVREDQLTLTPRSTVPEIFDHFMDTRRNHLYVLGRKHVFQGAVALHDLKQVMMQSQELGFMFAVDVMHTDFPHVLATDRLTSVLKIFAENDHERLPVLEDEETQRFVGFIAKRDLMAVYNQEVLGGPTMLAKFTSSSDEDHEQTAFVELPPNYRLDQLRVGDELAGKTLVQLNLPAEFQIHILEVKRGDEGGASQRVIPMGDTRLALGDQLVLLGRVEQLERLKQKFSPARPETTDD